MANDDTPSVPVGCPQCSAITPIRITHPAHKSVDCSGCGESFIVDQTLICRFYASDDTALSILEDLYRAPLVQYFLDRGASQVEAEEYQIDVFTRVWETKEPPNYRFQEFS
jgi:hypothetical protein